MPPESTSDQQVFETRTGFSISDIASQARERFLSIVPREGVVDLSWEEADQNEKAHWVNACEGLVEFLAEERDASFSSIAKLFARAYYGVDKWNSLNEYFRLAHEVAVRHIVNLVTAEDDEDARDALDHDWRKWSLSRMEKT